jgi:hypothetical protein
MRYYLYEAELRPPQSGSAGLVRTGDVGVDNEGFVSIHARSALQDRREMVSPKQWRISRHIHQHYHAATVGLVQVAARARFFTTGRSQPGDTAKAARELGGQDWRSRAASSRSRAKLLAAARPIRNTVRNAAQNKAFDAVAGGCL